MAGLLVLLLDQATKTLAARRLEEGQFYAVSRRIGLRLMTTNTPAGFIRLSDWQSIVLWVSIVGAASILALMRSSSIWGGIGFGMMLGGATSNLCDRLIRASVVDFIALKGWRTFNLADVSMVAGAVLFWSML